jgi:hypothetical protein
MIGNHPEMFGLAEINLFWAETVGELHTRLPGSFGERRAKAAQPRPMAFLRLLPEVRRRLESGLLRSLAEIAFQEQSDETIAATRSWLAENEAMSTAELFRTMSTWAGDRMLIDKSPLHVTNANALPLIGREFPDAYFLHLTRHPADTLKSVENIRKDVRETHASIGAEGQANGKEHVAASDADDVWLKWHARILEFLQDIPPERKMCVRGEDLLGDPPVHLAKIAKWLGVRTDAAAIEAMMHPEQSPFAKPGPPAAPFGTDPNFIRSPALRQFKFTPRPLGLTAEDGTLTRFSEPVIAQAKMFGYEDLVPEQHLEAVLEGEIRPLAAAKQLQETAVVVRADEKAERRGG